MPLPSPPLSPFLRMPPLMPTAPVCALREAGGGGLSHASPFVASLQFTRDLFPIALRTRLGLPQLGAAAYPTFECR